MATNRGDALLTTLRTRLLTAAGLPSVHAWLNQRSGTPSPTTAFVEDGFAYWGTTAREVGLSAWARSTVAYRVGVRTPIGTDAAALLAILVAITDVFRTGTTMSVLGAPVMVVSVQQSALLSEPQWLYATCTVVLTFDHA